VDLEKRGKDREGTKSERVGGDEKRRKGRKRSSSPKEGLEGSLIDRLGRGSISGEGRRKKRSVGSGSRVTKERKTTRNPPCVELVEIKSSRPQSSSHRRDSTPANG